MNSDMHQHFHRSK